MCLENQSKLYENVMHCFSINVYWCENRYCENFHNHCISSYFGAQNHIISRSRLNACHVLVGYKMSKRVGEVEEFTFEPLTEGNQLHVTIAVSGWLAEHQGQLVMWCFVECL